MNTFSFKKTLFAFRDLQVGPPGGGGAELQRLKLEQNKRQDTSIQKGPEFAFTTGPESLKDFDFDAPGGPGTGVQISDEGQQPLDFDNLISLPAFPPPDPGVSTEAYLQVMHQAAGDDGVLTEAELTAYVEKDADTPRTMEFTEQDAAIADLRQNFYNYAVADSKGSLEANTSISYGDILEVANQDFDGRNITNLDKQIAFDQEISPPGVIEGPIIGGPIPLPIIDDPDLIRDPILVNDGPGSGGAPLIIDGDSLLVNDGPGSGGAPLISDEGKST